MYQDGGWTKAEGKPDSATFTVMCEVSIPDAPTAGVLDSLDVRLRCRDDRNAHNCRFDVKAGTYSEFVKVDDFNYRLPFIRKPIWRTSTPAIRLPATRW